MAKTDGWGLGPDFSAAACHVDGCGQPVLTYWRSCYADLALCAEHEDIISLIEEEMIDLSCCWYPFSWRQTAA